MCSIELMTSTFFFFGGVFDGLPKFSYFSKKLGRCSSRVFMKKLIPVPVGEYRSLTIVL